MSESKSWKSTVKGWFVVSEKDDKPAAKEESVDDLIARYADAPPAAAAAPPDLPVLKGDVPRATGGQLDLPAIFRAADVTDEEQGRVSKAQSLLQTLPADTPITIKRQIVEASLKAFGYPINDLIEAAVQEIEALDAYIQHQGSITQGVLSDGAKRIELLQAEILELRRAMELAISDQAAATTACNRAKLEVQQVLEFFSQEEVGKIVKESPKLHEPR